VFTDIGPDRPGDIQVFDNNNRKVDIYDITNYVVTGASNTSVVQVAGYKAGNINLRRRLDFFSFPTAVQAGASHSIQVLDARRVSETWTYNGPDGNPATVDETAEPYRYRVYVNQKAHLGFGNFQGISSATAYRAWQANPILFSKTPAQVVTNETNRLTNSEYIEERLSTGYLQAEVRLFGNRLNVLGGVRFEMTNNDGQGLLVDPNAVFIRNTDGNFARNAQGARLRKPEAGADNSIEQLRLTHQERGNRSSRSYRGFYPSLHFTYNITENFLARLAYARTYGRPNFNEVIPNATINESDLTEEQMQDPAILPGSITVRNTGLKPWTADNYDLSLEFYSQQGGLFSAGVFQKEIRDFFGARVKIATAEDLDMVGLDRKYVGWNLSTKFNSGDARILGVEFNVRQPLRQLGGWGRYFTAFANATQLKLDGNPYASFTSFTPKSANWGYSFNVKRFSAIAKWNYRGLNKLTAQPATAPDAFQYLKARTTLDINLGYQLSGRLSLVGSVNNVFNVVPLYQQIYGSETPGYARNARRSEYGISFAVGLKGTF